MQQTCPYRAIISFNKNTHCFGTQQFSDIIYVYLLYSTMFYFTWRYITTYSRYYILHCITSHTHVQVRADFSVFNAGWWIQVMWYKHAFNAVSSSYPHTHMENGCHADSERFHNFDSYSELQTNTWENPTERKWKISQKLVVRVFHAFVAWEKLMRFDNSSCGTERNKRLKSNCGYLQPS